MVRQWPVHPARRDGSVASNESRKDKRGGGKKENHNRVTQKKRTETWMFLIIVLFIFFSSTSPFPSGVSVTDSLLWHARLTIVHVVFLLFLLTHTHTHGPTWWSVTLAAFYFFVWRRERQKPLDRWTMISFGDGHADGYWPMAVRKNRTATKHSLLMSLEKRIAIKVSGGEIEMDGKKKQKEREIDTKDSVGRLRCRAAAAGQADVDDVETRARQRTLWA